MNHDAWLPRRGAGTRHNLSRLYCLAYAGGSAHMYAPWQGTIDPAVEVCPIQLPGRGERFHEAPFTDLAELVRTIAHVIARQGRQPFSLFGHSLGGLLAFEISRFQMAAGLPLPQHLFVSGCAAPRYRPPGSGLHRLADAALVAALQDYKGTPAELLEHREVLPTVRADFALVENYRYQPGPLLELPLTVLAGREDPIDSRLQVEGWAEETTAECRVEWLDGDHFFIHPQRAKVISCIERALALGLDCNLV